MRPRIVLAGRDLPRLVSLGSELGPQVDETVVQSDRPLARLAGEKMRADAGIVLLSGSENVADLRAMLAAHPETHFLVLPEEYPASAAITRVVTTGGGAVLPRDEAPVVVAATIIAMLADETSAQ